VRKKSELSTSFIRTVEQLGLEVMSMRFLVLSFCLLSLPIAALAQKPVDAEEVGQDHFEADFPSGGHLRMHVRSGEIRIVGNDENKIQIHFGGKNGGRLKGVKVSLRASGDDGGELNVSGGPHNDFEIDISIPQKCDLRLRVPAGEVRVTGIAGDKDVELSAGELTVEVGKANDYAHVDASVYSGDLDAEPFSTMKSGLFRSFEQHGPGRYRLHAHVGAGELMLKQSGEL
jgi:hypothetical protein